MPHVSQLPARHITEESSDKGLSADRHAWLNAGRMGPPSEAVVIYALRPAERAASAGRLHTSREEQ